MYYGGYGPGTRGVEGAAPYRRGTTWRAPLAAAGGSVPCSPFPDP